jgi:hypothetical protein
VVTNASEISLWLTVITDSNWVNRSPVPSKVWNSAQVWACVKRILILYVYVRISRECYVRRKTPWCWCESVNGYKFQNPVQVVSWNCQW